MLFLRYACLLFFSVVICAMCVVAIFQGYLGLYLANVNGDSETEDISNHARRKKLGFYLLCLAALLWALPPLGVLAQILGYGVIFFATLSAVFHILCFIGQTKSWQKWEAFFEAEFAEEWRYHYEGRFIGCFALPEPLYVVGVRFRSATWCLTFLFRHPLRIR